MLARMPLLHRIRETLPCLFVEADGSRSPSRAYDRSLEEEGVLEYFLPRIVYHECQTALPRSVPSLVYEGIITAHGLRYIVQLPLARGFLHDVAELRLNAPLLEKTQSFLCIAAFFGSENLYHRGLLSNVSSIRYVDSFWRHTYSEFVAAPIGLIGKLVKYRHAPRHCKEAWNLSHGHCESGKAGEFERYASESGDRPHGRALSADIV